MSFGGSNSYSTSQSLTVLETLNFQASFFIQGLKDASKWPAVIETLMTNKIIQGNTMKAGLLQIIILVSALVIEPLLSHVNSRGQTTTSGTIPILFHVLWLYPLSLAAVYYAGLLRSNQDGERRGGVSTSLKGGDYRGLTSTITSESYRVLLLLNYFAVVYIFNLIPYIGFIFSFIYASIIDAYYCYESIWIKNSWSFEERVAFLSTRWAYFIGFGLPITALSWLSSDPVVNLAIFSLLYPFFNIMASSAIPQPLDPNTISSTLSLSFLPQAQGSFSMAAAEGGEEVRGKKGNPLIPKCLPVLFGADKLYGLVSKQVSMGIKKKDAGGYHGSTSVGGGYSNRSNGYGAGGRNQPPPQSSPYSHASSPYSQPPQQYQSQPNNRSNYTSNDVGGATRRGPVANSGGFADRSMDAMISSAARRSKRD